MPDIPEQNGVVERRNQILMDIVRGMMRNVICTNDLAKHYEMQTRFWIEFRVICT